jgi:hypothetical protein
MMATMRGQWIIPRTDFQHECRQFLPEGARLVHHKMDKMLLKQNTDSVGQAAFHFKDRA